MIETGTCSPWATTADVCSPCDDYAFDPVVLEDCLQVASDVLFELTSRRWPGVCAEVVRPNAQYRAHDGPRYWGHLVGRIGASSSPWGWCSCNRPREWGCSSLSEVLLGASPVLSITEVLVDGVVVAPGEYRVDDHRYLVGLERADGTRRRWPCCQNMALPDTEEGTWSVAYTYGLEPPLGGVRAAAALGCQLALACQPETVGKCRLPKRITSITRQGVTVAVLDPLTLFADGLTGLAEVDLWVQSTRLGVARRRATVLVPGQARDVRRPGT